MEKIRKLRQEIGMSQKDLIVKLGVKQSHYSSLENGVYFPKNRDKIKQDAIDLMYPVLIQKILDKRAELEQLENFSLQFKPSK